MLLKNFGVKATQHYGDGLNFSKKIQGTGISQFSPIFNGN